MKFVYAWILFAASFYAIGVDEYRVEKDFWDEDAYVVKDSEGDVKGRIKKDFWSGDYIFETGNGESLDLGLEERKR
jgi:hypothetical protein